MRPPELVAPEPIASLRAQVRADGVSLEWRRPAEDVGGDRLNDLAGFVIERATGRTAPFSVIGEIAVTDRERFRKLQRFRFHDREVSAGTLYRYRVVSFRVDRYVSAPSNEVEVRIPEETPPDRGQE